MMRTLVVSSLALLCSCSSLKSRFTSALPNSSVRVRELGVQELGQGTFEGLAPPQSSVAPIFLGGDNLLLTTMGGSIEVRDVRTFEPRWKQPVYIGVGAQPLVVGSSVIVAGMDSQVRRIRLSTGEVEWTTKILAESPGGIAASQGFAYVTAGDDSLSALDERTGAGVWSYKRPAREGNVLWSLKGSAIPVLSADGQTLYAGFSDGAFVALEASSGKTLWERNFDRSGRFKDADTAPILSNDGNVLYLALVDGDLVALRTRDGSTLWTLPGAASTPPFVDPVEKALYLSTRDYKLLKISLEDNHTVWSVNLQNRGIGSKPVAVLDNYLALTTSRAGALLIERSTGRIMWESDFAIGSLAPPAFDGRRMAVLSARNRLHLYTVEKVTEKVL